MLRVVREVATAAMEGRFGRYAVEFVTRLKEETMSIAPIPVDRRERRSDECRQAIHFQLLHLADKYELQNLVLADASGLMIAAAGDTVEGQALAAYAPLFSRRLDRGTRNELMDEISSYLPGVDGQMLSVRRFQMNGQEHFLCVVGEKRLCRQANLYRAVTGIRRIVDETASD